MATLPQRRLIQQRDIDVFTALDRCPLTAEQLLKASTAFAMPFASLRRVQDRLRKLCDGGYLNAYWYTGTDPLRPGTNRRYFKLTPDTYQLLHGTEMTPRSREYFRPIPASRQPHTERLADFIVHTGLAAHHRGLRIENFHGEDRLRVDVAGETFFPDATFDLVSPSGYRFAYAVELDRSTERVRTAVSHVESWKRKLRRYAMHYRYTGQRRRLLVVTTQCPQRLRNILALAGEMTRDLDFPLVYGITFDDYLAYDDALFAGCFRTTRLKRASLLADLGRHEQRLSASVQPLVAQPLAC